MTATRQTDQLQDELSNLHGTEFDGPRCIIFFPFDTPTKYLAGYPYLFTGFAERAYELGEHTARKLIERYPELLGDATILHTKRS